MGLTARSVPLVVQPYICVQDSLLIHPLRHFCLLDGAHTASQVTRPAFTQSLPLRDGASGGEKAETPLALGRVESAILSRGRSIHGQIEG